MFIPLEATGYSTLEEACNYAWRAMHNAGAPRGISTSTGKTASKVWVYSGDHMILVKGDADDRVFGRIEEISRITKTLVQDQVIA